MAKAQNATIKVTRFDPESGGESYVDAFDVPIVPALTVLDALYYILDNVDGSLAFRASCRSAVCGSCAMYINGRYRLACNTQVSVLLPGDITVSPLPSFPVIKDLVVDLDPFWEQLERIKPYLIRRTPPPEKEFLVDPKNRNSIDEMLDCILCAACFSSCPVVWLDKRFIGPAQMVKAYRFVQDARDQGANERLPILDTTHGVWRCHTVFNCTDACPKNINCTYSIQHLKRKAAIRRLKFWSRLTS